MGRSHDFPFGIMDVVELLRIRIRRPYGDGCYYTDCPLCGDRRGKMSISTKLDAYHCHHCGEHGGMLELYSRVCGVSKSDAYREICEALQNGEFTPAVSTYAPAPCGQEPVVCSQIADARTLHQTFSMMLDLLTLTKAHREHLRTERGLTDEQIDELGYKSTPPFYLCRKMTRQLIEKGCTVQGIPGFYQKDGIWTVGFYSKTAGIIIPVRGIDGLIRGMQIRLDVPIRNEDDDPDKSGTKYIWLSSAGKSMGTSSGSPLHFVGDPQSHTVYVTEGFLKADVSHYLMNRTFVASAGVNNEAQMELMFKLLAESGTHTIIECADMDKYRNENVDRGVSKWYALARKCGLEFRRLTWNPNYKGVDDWQLSLKRKRMEKEDRTTTFKKRFLRGLCDFNALDDEIGEWHESPEQTKSLQEYLGFADEDERKLLLGDDELLAHLLTQQREQKYRIYQLDFADGKPKPFAFEGMKALKKAGYDQPPAALYRLAGEGALSCCADDDDTVCLHLLFSRYNGVLPADYSGRSIASSDVIELYDDETRRYFYCDSSGFCPVRFSPMLVKK